MEIRFPQGLTFKGQNMRNNAQKDVGVSLHGVSALCFPGYINITQYSLPLLCSRRFASFMSKWIFMLSCNCHLSNSIVAIIRGNMMLQDEALTHGRVNAFAEQYLELMRFFALCVSFFSYWTVLAWSCSPKCPKNVEF